MGVFRNKLGETGRWVVEGQDGRVEGEKCEAQVRAGGRWVCELRFIHLFSHPLCDSLEVTHVAASCLSACLSQVPT